MKREIYAAISPLDHRYYAGAPALFERLSEYLSENAYVRYQARVEAALTKVLARRHLCPPEVSVEVEKAASEITPDEVYAEEAKTHHNIRAMVNCLQRRVSEEARPFVHFTATSWDIMDTARALQYRDVTDRVLLPLLYELLGILIEITKREACTPQIGRTHGQHAVPITFGFAMAEYVARLGERLVALKEAAANLRGKMAGAVGAYNAASLFFADPETFEEEVLAELGLSPAMHATQIVAPEYVTDWVHSLLTVMGVLANLGDDLRQLQRTEIAEVGEAFQAGQVGSSTMPHKRNPWNFEHVKSIWKVFAPRIVTLYMDQISEHQRDLTNSASSRFIPEVAAGLADMADHLLRVLRKLVVDRERMAANLHLQKEMIVAEPLYIILASLGHPDAHEAVRRLTLASEKSGRPLYQLAAESEELAPYLARLTPNQLQVLEKPESYTGVAARKAAATAAYWENWLRNITSEREAN
ncbi:MAG TPA: adenylosuccinate lyase [Firmicutes bacterium]|nr:adenylosuccinate lyase [Bacillota bacterium]